MKRRLTRLAKPLRRNATIAERLLWQKLRNKQLEGFKFRRQQPIGNYIVDFVNFKKLLIIELDGGQHSIFRGKDQNRDVWFQSQGYRVLRFWNNDVLENIDGVLSVIRKTLISPSP